MPALWFLVAAVTAVMAEDSKTCSLVGDPHLTTFNHTLNRALINYPCRYQVASMCLQDENQICQKNLYIFATNGDMNGRGNSFLSYVDGMVYIRGQQILSGRFVLDITALQTRNPDPWKTFMNEETKDSVCIEYPKGERLSVSVSIRSGNDCIPVFTFRPHLPPREKSALIITSGRGVVPVTDTGYQFPYSLCGFLDDKKVPATFRGLSDLQQQVMLASLLQQLQFEGNCQKARENAMKCSAPGSLSPTIQKCEPYTTPKYVSCYKKHGHTTVTEVLAYCFLHYCGSDFDRAAVKDWMGQLPQVCLISFT